MIQKFSLKTLSLSAVFASQFSFAADVPLLNHNFDSDAIQPDQGYTSFISGWVNSGHGEIGVWAPISNGPVFTDMDERGQIAYLNEGGRFSQTASTSLIEGETYTLSFDVGRSLTQVNSHFVVRFKAKGLVVAQAHSDTFSTPAGGWSTESLSFTATGSMPVGEPLVVEFHNLATETQHQINLDNVYLTTAGTANTNPQPGLPSQNMIVEDTTLLVPGSYPNINAALSHLNDKHIKVGKTVTIKVTDCTNQIYNSDPINISHPNGEAIHIIGKSTNPMDCMLNIQWGPGIIVDNGNQLGLIDGFFLTGSRSYGNHGISALNGSAITIGQNMRISNFDIGVLASHNSTIHAKSIEASYNEGAGFESAHSSSIDATSAYTTGNAFGFRAENNSVIIANRADSNNDVVYGFSAVFGSTIEARDTRAVSADYGFQAWGNSFIDARRTDSSGHTYGDYREETGGNILKD